MKPLHGLRCLVETSSEDGSNSSPIYEAMLHNLGATTSQVMHEHLSHYICINVSIRRILAARLMNVDVVSPQWIEACRDANTRVDEKDYLLSSDLVELIASIDGPSSEVVPVMTEPVAKLAHALKSFTSSPLFSSSHSNHGSQREKSSLAASQSQSQSMAASHSQQQQQPLLNIPLPTFREYRQPAVNVDNVLKRRRSERLIDLEEDSDDDLLDDLVDNSQEDDGKQATGHGSDQKKSNKTSMANKKRKTNTSAVADVTAEQPLPIIYQADPLAAQEAIDFFHYNLPIETEIEKQQRLLREELEKKANISRYHLLKKERLDQQQQQQQQAAAQKGGSNNNNSNTSSPKRRGRPPANQQASPGPSPVATINNNNNKKQAANNNNTSSSSHSSSKSRAAPPPITGSLTIPWVIALTGFDRKNGDYDTMLDTIQGFIGQMKGQGEGGKALGKATVKAVGKAVKEAVIVAVTVIAIVSSIVKIVIIISHHLNKMSA